MHTRNGPSSHTNTCTLKLAEKQSNKEIMMSPISLESAPSTLAWSWISLLGTSGRDGRREKGADIGGREEDGLGIPA